MTFSCVRCHQGNIIKGPAYASYDKSAWLCGKHQAEEIVKLRA